MTWNKKVVISVFLVWIAAVLPALAINRVTWSPIRPPLTEAVVHLVLILLLASFQPVVHFLTHLPRLHSKILIGIVALLLFGQIANRTAATYPFVTWSMYGESPKEKIVNYFEIYGVDREGNRVRLNPSRLFPYLRRNLGYASHIWLMQEVKSSLPEEEEEEIEEQTTPPLSSGLRKTLKNIASYIRAYFKTDHAVDLEMARENINKFYRGLGQGYNERHPERLIHQILIFHGTLKPESNALPELELTPLRTVDLF